MLPTTLSYQLSVMGWARGLLSLPLMEPPRENKVSEGDELELDSATPSIVGIAVCGNV